MGPPEKTSGGGEEESQQENQTAESTGRVAKIAILRLELPTTMKDEAVNHLNEIFQATPNVIEKDIATDMKKHFDQKFGPTWHCIVGKSFGCSIAYDTQFLLFFQADQHYFLLFKSTE